MTVLYNEHDAYPAAWLRNLIAAGALPDGRVDERSIADLEPADCPEEFHDLRGMWQEVLGEVASKPEQDLFCAVCCGVGPHLGWTEVAPRTGRLRAYGNALCAEVAIEFVRAVKECLDDSR